jgi:tRNA modification GTPase
VLLLTEADDDLQLIQQSIEAIRQQIDGGKQLVVVLNKSDRLPGVQQKTLQKKITLLENERIISISAEQGKNIDELARMLLEIVNLGSIKHQDVVISNIRHYNALKSASEGLSRVAEGLNSGLTSDLLAQDIREVLHFLGEITGEVTSDEILGNIFKNFCIGK